jgi:hypothetical protein
MLGYCLVVIFAFAFVGLYIAGMKTQNIGNFWLTRALFSWAWATMGVVFFTPHSYQLWYSTSPVAGVGVTIISAVFLVIILYGFYCLSKHRASRTN